MKPKEYQFTTKGSLGLLALGDLGSTEWRKYRDQQKNAVKKKIDNEKK